MQTLLQKPDHEIDRMKLSVTHLRLLQEARERIQVSCARLLGLPSLLEYYAVAHDFCFGLS